MIPALIIQMRELCPSWRYGQIIANAIRASNQVSPAQQVSCDPFHVQDEALEEGLRNLIQQYKGR